MSSFDWNDVVNFPTDARRCRPHMAQAHCLFKNQIIKFGRFCGIRSFLVEMPKSRDFSIYRVVLLSDFGERSTPTSRSRLDTRQVFQMAYLLQLGLCFFVAHLTHIRDVAFLALIQSAVAHSLVQRKGFHWLYLHAAVALLFHGITNQSLCPREPSRHQLAQVAFAAANATCALPLATGNGNSRRRG